MSAVIGEQQDLSWWQYAWQEHRAWVLTFFVLVVSFIVFRIQGGETVFPENWIEAFPFAERVNEFDKWLRPFIQPTTRAIGAGVTGGSIFVGTAWLALFCMWIGAMAADWALDQRPGAVTV